MSVARGHDSANLPYPILIEPDGTVHILSNGKDSLGNLHPTLVEADGTVHVLVTGGVMNPPEKILINDASLSTWGPTMVTTETILKTILIPANTLDANSFLHILALVQEIGSGSSGTIRVRVGGVAGTIIAEWVRSGGSSSEMYMGQIDAWLSNKNAQNINRGYTRCNGANTEGVAYNTAIDFSVAQNLVITGTVGGGTNVTINVYYFYAGYVL